MGFPTSEIPGDSDEDINVFAWAASLLFAAAVLPRATKEPLQAVSKIPSAARWRVLR